MGSPYRILLTAAIVAGPGSRFAVARVANLSATAPQRALPVVPSSLSYPFPWTILRLKSERTGIHSASLKKNGSAKSMQPIFGFSIGSMRTRRVSTTLRQVLTEFSERFSFPQGNFAPGSPSNDDRQLGRPTASPLFLFHLPLPTGSGSGVGTGLLIQTALGRTGGLGALRTKRSG